eukprot:COSAG01_NODE_11114_length_2004_cov_10.482940_1_plen_616_part_01
MQEFLGFEGSGQRWRLLITSTFEASDASSAGGAESAAAVVAAERSVITQKGWREVDNWPATMSTLASSSTHWDAATGRMTFMKGGTHLVHTNVFLGSCDSTVSVAVVRNSRVGSGLWQTLSNSAASLRHSFSISGALDLAPGDFISLWMQQRGSSCMVQSRSSLSVVSLGTVSGCGTSLHTSQPVSSIGWKEVKGWAAMTRGGGWLLGSGLDAATGRFAAPVSGIYIASSQLQLDGADSGPFSVMLAMNGLIDRNNGRHVLRSNPQSARDSFSATGLMRMQTRDYVSVWVYAQQDSRYTVHSQSGFSCALLETSLGFAADLAAAQAVSSAGWTEVTGWETSGQGGRAGLFALGSGFDTATGRYTAARSMLYFVYSQCYASAAGVFTVAVAINGNQDIFTGLLFSSQQQQKQQQPLYNQREEKISHSLSSIVHLAKNDFISVWLTTTAGGLVLESGSSFGCTSLVAATGVSFAASTNLWTEVSLFQSSKVSTGSFNIGNDFNPATGRFTVLTEAYVFAAGNLRIRGDSDGLIKVSIALNAAPHHDNGMHVTRGESRNLALSADFSMSGMLHMYAGDFVSVWVYTGGHISYTVSGHSSFSCAKLQTSAGFGADLGPSN